MKDLGFFETSRLSQSLCADNESASSLLYFVYGFVAQALGPRGAKLSLSNLKKIKFLSPSVVV